MLFNSRTLGLFQTTLIFLAIFFSQSMPVYVIFIVMEMFCVCDKCVNLNVVCYLA